MHSDGVYRAPSRGQTVSTKEAGSGIASVAQEFMRLLSLLEKEAGKPLDNLYVWVFLHIAEQGRGVGNSELERVLSLSKAQASRAVSELSELSWRKDQRGYKVKGLGWVREERDQRDARNKPWVLSERGQRVYDKVRKA